MMERLEIYPIFKSAITKMSYNGVYQYVELCKVLKVKKDMELIKKKLNFKSTNHPIQLVFCLLFSEDFEGKDSVDVINYIKNNFTLDELNENFIMGLLE